jgi:hypothetical protein
MKYSLFFLLFFINFYSFSQKKPLLLEKRGEYFSRFQMVVETSSEYTLNNGMRFTGVVIFIEDNSSFDGAYIHYGTQKIFLQEDEHGGQHYGLTNSAVVVFDEQVDEVGLYTGSIEGSIVIDFLNAGKAPDISNQRKMFEEMEGCALPDGIPQSVWREGLPEPNYTRSFDKTSHLIIHHSAGSNTSSNYTNVVRNIYLYHTQSNGWSDIGYNYLIAQDGSIFWGRDPGPGGEQDQVRGAHFCGKNSNTMGVCMLGTYSSEIPTFESIESLTKLISWKVKKEGFDPLAREIHAGSNLFIISGHRDGCATECPGNQFYQTFTSFRGTVNDYVIECDKPTPELAELYKVYPIPSSDKLTFRFDPDKRISYINVYDLHGKQYSLFSYAHDLDFISLEIAPLKSGIYFISIKEGNNYYNQRFVKK